MKLNWQPNAGCLLTFLCVGVIKGSPTFSLKCRTNVSAEFVTDSSLPLLYITLFRLQCTWYRVVCQTLSQYYQLFIHKCEYVYVSGAGRQAVTHTPNTSTCFYVYSLIAYQLSAVHVTGEFSWLCRHTPTPLIRYSQLWCKCQLAQMCK